MKMDCYANVRVNEDHIVTCLTTECDNSKNSEETGYYIAVMGKVYGRPDFVDGKLICTSAIKEADEKTIRTYSGSIYELGAKDPDYVKFEEAIASGIPILENWSIGNLYKGVYIKGNIRGNNTPFHKKVVAQEGSILTFHDGSKAFVDWVTIDPFQLKYINGIGHLFIKGRLFCGIALEPDILNSDWTLVATAVPHTDESAALFGII